jgi:hypothetical protein
MKRVKAPVVEEGKAHHGSRPGEFDPHRKWTNGHKSFTSSESRALNELLDKERTTQERFQELKTVMKKPRNPLNGEPTPRDVRGEIILNPNAHGQATGGNLLYDPDAHARFDPGRFEKKAPQGKIGVVEEKYDILGNTTQPSNPAEPEDLYYLAKKNQMKMIAKKADEDAIKAALVKEKLRRYELDMVRQVEALKQQLNEKEKTIKTFSTLDMSRFTSTS